jgi:DNA-binding NtrC family response regulator
MAPFNILIIDDNVLISKVIMESLQNGVFFDSTEWRIETAATGKRALEMHATSPFDFFIIDINLPDMSGLDLLIKLKPIENDYEVVMITGYRVVPEEWTCRKLGALDYLEKPFSMERIAWATKKAYGMKQELTDDFKKA